MTHEIFSNSRDSSRLSSIDRIESALSFIPPQDRAIWVKMGMAVKSQLGEDGFKIWDAWSQQADSYNSKDAKSVWKSIRASGNVTVATLFFEANCHGWNGKDEYQTPTSVGVEERKSIALEKIVQVEAGEMERHAKAAKQAATIWDVSSPAPDDHPYLQKKGVRAYGTRLHDDKLVIPLRDLAGTLHSLQTITPDGDKRFLPDGRVSGCNYLIGTLDGATKIAVCEGFSTAATIHQATGLPVAVAFNAGNLLAVAESLRENFSDLPMIICGDDDHKRNGNPGLTKAKEAARKAGAFLAVPEFGTARPDSATDFNDLGALRGLEAVKKGITGAALPSPEAGTTPPPKSVATDNSAWPEPSPLPKLPPVPDFPFEILPNELQGYISDCASRARYRIDFAAVSSMVGLGSVIGRKLGIRLKTHDNWTEFANIWGGCIGPPSALKSPATRDGMTPFKALQESADKIHEKALESYAVELEAYKLRKEALKKNAINALAKNSKAQIDLGADSEPEEPTPRTYWTSDATAAKLGELLAENASGLLVERDELSSLLSTLESESNADARGLYLSGWSGNEGYRFDRISRGTVTLPRYALSVVGGIQPGPLTRYVRSAFCGERADGLLQRFQLLVWPDAEPFQYSDLTPDDKARKAALELFERADTFDPQTIGQKDDPHSNVPPFVRLSTEAQMVFVEWYTRFMQSARSAGSSEIVSAPLAAHFGKYPGLVGKLALILHVADNRGVREVPVETMFKALAWIDYLTPHAQRVYHAAEHPETTVAELLLARINRGELPPHFKAWEISRKGWHGLSDRESVKKACRLLYEFGWLIELDPGGASGGRPADPVYAVSPRVLGAA